MDVRQDTAVVLCLFCLIARQLSDLRLWRLFQRTTLPPYGCMRLLKWARISFANHTMLVKVKVNTLKAAEYASYLVVYISRAFNEFVRSQLLLSIIHTCTYSQQGTQEEHVISSRKVLGVIRIQTRDLLAVRQQRYPVIHCMTSIFDEAIKSFQVNRQTK